MVDTQVIINKLAYILLTKHTRGEVEVTEYLLNELEDKILIKYDKDKNIYTFRTREYNNKAVNKW